MNEHQFIPLKSLVLCNNEHAYDAALSGLCPACESYDRMSVDALLSPPILGRRLLAAVAALKEKR